MPGTSAKFQMRFYKGAEVSRQGLGATVQLLQRCVFGTTSGRVLSSPNWLDRAGQKGPLPHY